uniref:mannose-6-phosphate isomerase n=1 Tax=Helicotheca tamesis TaxID=374047 RepID=A0A7S2HDI8_9STRA|mmetsp:Transcript_17212/g.23664  ORF Transcript_17212/g.23664 Transcript_17212/m.23664 type:complete len:465 (+) Transcript_17212:81-1475(+)
MVSLQTYDKGGTMVVPLRPCVKDYAWGIRGLDSRVARYALESGIIDEVDPDSPYAELWIGTHPKGPTTLRDGSTLEEAVGGQLPFLFKVLSAGKALSIQAHPDLTGAKRLHKENPSNYGDPNHKPEMAIALTPFEAMCGFRRIEEIAILIKKHHEFAACISEKAKLDVFLASDEESGRLALKAMFRSFMECPKDESLKNLKSLLKRLQSEQGGFHPHQEPPWERKCARAILRLAQQFPGDPGAMSPFFLNYLLIAPGESFYMAANEPHAYVAGEIIECMACSDNVVRAGLTPKFKDVPNLVNMLTYSMGGPSIDAGASPTFNEDRIQRYTPPTKEFEVMVLTCNPGEDLKMPVLPVPAVFVVIEGNGSTDNPHGQRLVMRPGRSYYVPPNCPPLTLSVHESKRGPLKIAIAHENQHMHDPTMKPAGSPQTYAGEFYMGASPRNPKSPKRNLKENGCPQPPTLED